MNRWIKTDGGYGWTHYARGDHRITVSPSGVVTLFAPACTSTHKSLEAAKRAARRNP